ncbi:MAG: serine/threonine protein kinase [Planctomycetes bacterium]|nr:serine/threonine protein kinase [Planctomycetota bacterium]
MSTTSQNGSTEDSLEDVLALALSAREEGGDAALEGYLATVGALAPAVRAALAELRGCDLLEPVIAGLPPQLGDFRLREVLGAGGMGVVYLAEQVSLGREVALKVVRPELLFFEGARERFRREIEAVARLEHPAIVPILATGSADGIPYYAMPRLRGRSAESLIAALRDLDPKSLDAGCLTALLASPEAAATRSATGGSEYWRAVTGLVAQAAHGIAHAHRRGVLHRDLKPSNLMLTSDGRAIVLDFGLALARGDERLTRSGATAGSPAYMAPEQLRGEPADERTDVYGLCATLHALLARKSPFPLADGEVLRARVLAGRRDELRRELPMPAELRLVLECGMDVERARRHPSAEALAADLEAVLEGRPIRARRVPWPVRARRMAQRHPALGVAGVAALVFAIALPSVVLWQQRRANVELAEAARVADRSVVISIDAVEQQLARVAERRLRNLPAAQELAAELLREAIALFDSLGAVPQHAERVAMLRLRAMLRLTEIEAALGQPDRAARSAERALAAIGEGERPPAAALLRARAARQLAVATLELEPRAELDVLLAAAARDLATARAEPALHDEVLREEGLWAGVEATLANARGDAAAVEAALRRAVAASAQRRDEGIAHGVAWLNLCRFLKQTGRHAEALAAADAAESAVTGLGPMEFGWPVPRAVVAMVGAERGRIQQQLGQLDAASATLRGALERLDEVLRDYPDEPSTRRVRGATAHQLAGLCVQRGDHAAARTLAEAAIADQTAVLARNPRDAEAMAFLGNHRRTLCTVLRQLADLPALERESRAMGAMPGPPELPGAAARNLLRCAAADPSRATELEREALELLGEAVRRGGRVDAKDPLYAPLRALPGFDALLQKR